MTFFSRDNAATQYPFHTVMSLLLNDTEPVLMAELVELMNSNLQSFDVSGNLFQLMGDDFVQLRDFGAVKVNVSDYMKVINTTVGMYHFITTIHIHASILCLSGSFSAAKKPFSRGYFLLLFVVFRDMFVYIRIAVIFEILRVFVALDTQTYQLP